MKATCLDPAACGHGCRHGNHDDNHRDLNVPATHKSSRRSDRSLNRAEPPSSGVRLCLGTRDSGAATNAEDAARPRGKRVVRSLHSNVRSCGERNCLVASLLGALAPDTGWQGDRGRNPCSHHWRGRNGSASRYRPKHRDLKCAYHPIYRTPPGLLSFVVGSIGRPFNAMLGSRRLICCVKLFAAFILNMSSQQTRHSFAPSRRPSTQRDHFLRMSWTEGGQLKMMTEHGAGCVQPRRG